MTNNDETINDETDNETDVNSDLSKETDSNEENTSLFGVMTFV